MKVFWFSNCNLLQKNINTGSWLYAMSRGLIRNGVTLINLTEGKTRDINRIDEAGIIQYLIPRYKRIKGVPSCNSLKIISNIVEEENPDIVHIWGTESYWGLLSSRGYINRLSILEIQGLKYSCSRVYNGNLNLSEQLKCIGLKELIRPSSSLFAIRNSFSRWSKIEQEILRGQKYISTQSDWVRRQIKPYIDKKTEILETRMAIRNEFFDEKYSWISNSSRTILVMSAGSIPYKGLHDIIKALYIIKREYPTVKLKIIGVTDHHAKPWRKSGYTKFLESLAQKYNLTSSIEYTGALGAIEIASLMQNAEVMVIPSYVESYCLAMAEAMAIGLPCVATYAGALPELGDSNNTLFYQPGDIESLAFNVISLFGDNKRKERVSREYRTIAQNRNSIESVYQKQYQIYSTVLSRNNNL